MIVLSNRQIFALVRSSELVPCLREAFRGAFTSPDRIHCDLPGEDGAKLLIMPAWRSRADLGVKLATVVPRNPSRDLPTVNGIYVLFDGETGEVRAALEAASLTVLRTAAVSALASQLLSREDARRLLLVGTGALIPHLAEAHLAVRRGIEEIVVWGREREKAVRMANQLRDLAVRIEVAEDLESSVRCSDIISCATMSQAPLVQGCWLKPGAHVDLVGSFTPNMREADDEVFRGARVAVDTRAALSESGDLIAPVALGIVAADAPDLRGLLLDPALLRSAEDEVTVFKSVGTALSDIAAAQRIVALHQSSLQHVEQKSRDKAQAG